MIGMTCNLRVKIDLRLCLTLKVQCVIPCLNEGDVNNIICCRDRKSLAILYTSTEATWRETHMVVSNTHQLE